MQRLVCDKMWPDATSSDIAVTTHAQTCPASVQIHWHHAIKRSFISCCSTVHNCIRKAFYTRLSCILMVKICHIMKFQAWVIILECAVKYEIHINMYWTYKHVVENINELGSVGIGTWWLINLDATSFFAHCIFQKIILAMKCFWNRKKHTYCSKICFLSHF